MVDPAVQRCGIGRSLLDRHVAKEVRAWLVTLPGSPAASLHESAGWHRLSPHFTLWGRELEAWTKHEAATALGQHARSLP
jgi:GNAT superfamily N-acetyltransferase